MVGLSYPGKIRLCSSDVYFFSCCIKLVSHCLKHRSSSELKRGQPGRDRFKMRSGGFEDVDKEIDRKDKASGEEIVSDQSTEPTGDGVIMTKEMKKQNRGSFGYGAREKMNEVLRQVRERKMLKKEKDREERDKKKEDKEEAEREKREKEKEKERDKGIEGKEWEKASDGRERSADKDRTGSKESDKDKNAADKKQRATRRISIKFSRKPCSDKSSSCERSIDKSIDGGSAKSSANSEKSSSGGSKREKSRSNIERRSGSAIDKSDTLQVNSSIAKKTSPRSQTTGSVVSSLKEVYAKEKRDNDKEGDKKRDRDRDRERERERERDRDRDRDRDREKERDRDKQLKLPRSSTTDVSSHRKNAHALPHSLSTGSLDNKVQRSDTGTHKEGKSSSSPHHSPTSPSSPRRRGHSFGSSSSMARKNSSGTYKEKNSKDREEKESEGGGRDSREGRERDKKEEKEKVSPTSLDAAAKGAIPLYC